MTKNELENLILRHEELYRVGNPEITDSEFDKLKDELFKVYPESKVFSKPSVAPKTRKKALPYPMFSLEKVKTVEEIKDFFDVTPETLIIITPKFDGISLLKDGNDVYTRGDGFEGQDASNHFKLINSKIDIDGVVYGEVIMKRKSFVDNFSNDFANPRNLVAGLFNRDEPTDDLKFVDFIPYGTDQERSKMDILSSLNTRFCLSSRETISLEFLNHVYQLYSEIYDIDGLVLELNDHETREKLGRFDNGNPKFAVAFKNPEWAESAEVRVLEVTTEVSKQGNLIPVISINPTTLCGVTISRLTGYNMKYIVDNDIASDSVIKIVRSGDVIPKHIETISSNTENVHDLLDRLTECPSCGSVTSWDKTMTHLVCKNKDCKDRVINSTLHAFKTLGFEEVGKPFVEKLYKAGFKTFLETLKISDVDFLNIDGFGLSMLDNFKAQKIKIFTPELPLAKILHALDKMDGVAGEKTLQLIFDNVPNLLDFNVLKSDLLSVNGIGEVTADKFLQIWNLDLITKDIPFAFTISKPKHEGVLSGQRFCFTGCRPDKELEDKILKQGGTIVSGVSSKTTHLVVKDLSEKTLKSQKSKDAVKLGIQIIQISDL